MFSPQNSLATEVDVEEALQDFVGAEGDSELGGGPEHAGWGRKHHWEGAGETRTFPSEYSLSYSFFFLFSLFLL